MSIVVGDLFFHYSHQPNLFNGLSFSVNDRDKVAIVGNNGTGKSTLLLLMAGLLQAVAGSVTASSRPYYVRQHTGRMTGTVAEALEVAGKLAALHAIEQGSVRPDDYEILADDWEVEARCRVALDYWRLPHIGLDTPVALLSGGERTKVLLAGLLIHTPEIILMDEPSNHLDQTSRELLYRFVAQSKAAIVVVSHDVTLLNQLDKTYELSAQGMKFYGGNYDFYREQKAIATNALSAGIDEQEKQLRLARKKAQEVRERQERRAAQGERSKQKGGAPRILLHAKRGVAENTAARLGGKHMELIGESRTRLTELRQQQERSATLQLDFDNTTLHAGKLLIAAEAVNFAYSQHQPLWTSSIDFKLFSDDRIRILGDNGAGKTTFLQLLTGSLTPSEGTVKRADFSWIYLDQHYTQVDTDDTVVSLAERYNAQLLEEHEIKIRLNRFLFPADSWDKPCRTLSGGEKMRLYLCCLMISNHTPDLIVLDEPTNNLDIASLEILMETIRNYKGSLLVISHDWNFIHAIGITAEIMLI